MLQPLLLALALLFVLATALPLFRQPYWWIRAFDFPRLQLVIIGAVVLALYVAFYSRSAWWEWVVLGLVAVALGYQLFRIAPYTPLGPKQTLGARAAEGRRLRVVMTNVLMENRDFERWERVVREADPDLYVAVETDAWWAERMRALEDAWPHAVEVPMDNTYGLVVRSRYPLRDTEVRHLLEEDVPSVWGAVELPDGVPVRFAFIHPRPPRPDIQQGSEFRDAELVLVAREVERMGDGAIVVAGDLNDVAWSHTTRLFQRISGLLDPRRGRGMFSTFNAENVLLRWPLDHVFHSDELGLVELRLLDKVGSDHFPLLIEFAHRPELEHLQEEPEADADDEAEAREHVEEAHETLREETPEEAAERRAEDR